MLCLAAVACRNSEPVRVTDSEGRRFAVRCGDAGCSAEPIEHSASAPRGAAKFSLQISGRLLGVCTAFGDAPPHPGDCRPLRCSTDAECPAVRGEGYGTCVGAWCVEPSREPGTNDAILLCLAGTGVGHDSAQQAQRYAMAVNCGSPCVVPAPCKRL